MHDQTEHQQRRVTPGAPTGTDPVCGMKVSVESAYRHALNGSEAVFCRVPCRDRFASDPSKHSAEKQANEPGFCPNSVIDNALRVRRANV
jgi:Cu+-exporting ATPase